MLYLLKEIFSQKKYVAIFILSTTLIWFTIGLYQHGETFVSLWGIFSFWKWILFVLSFSELVIANTTDLGLTIMILNIIGISLYIVLKTYAYQIHSKTRTTIGVIGSILVFFGIGCASCGSLALISIISFFGFGSALFLLPFGGSEIPYIALVLLVISNFILMRQLAKKVCPV